MRLALAACRKLESLISAIFFSFSAKMSKIKMDCSQIAVIISRIYGPYANDIFHFKTFHRPNQCFLILDLQLWHWTISKRIALICLVVGESTKHNDWRIETSKFTQIIRFKQCFLETTVKAATIYESLQVGYLVFSIEQQQQKVFSLIFFSLKLLDLSS